MKKHSRSLLLISTTLLIISGCGDNQSIARNNQAYIVDGNGEEIAVNTLQAGSKYKIVGPMDDLKDAVREILGENYWPDTLLERGFPQICMRITLPNISIRKPEST